MTIKSAADGLSHWINHTSMTSLLQLVLLPLVVIGVLWLTHASVQLLLTGPIDWYGKVPLSTDPAKLTESMSLHYGFADRFMTDRRNTGFNLALAILAGLGLLKGINTLQHGKDRSTSREFLQGQAEVEANRVEAERAIATREHHAQEADADAAAERSRPRA